MTSVTFITGSESLRTFVIFIPSYPGLGDPAEPLLHPAVLGGDLHRGVRPRISNLMPGFNVVSEETRSFDCIMHVILNV